MWCVARVTCLVPLKLAEGASSSFKLIKFNLHFDNSISHCFLQSTNEKQRAFIEIDVIS